MVNIIAMSNQMMSTQPAKKNSKFKQKFKQQRLPAWQPILTADTVLPTFFLIGLLLIPLGVALMYFSNNVREKEIDYTKCESQEFGPKLCEEIIAEKTWNASINTCTCKLPFKLKEAFESNVYVYYGLSNFYQNHRRYVKSRDDNQLFGRKQSEVDASCSPFDTEGGKPYAPCGAIANSLFNDELTILDKEGNEVLSLNTGIAWPSDKQRKFDNPPGSKDPLSDEFMFKDTVKPPFWIKPVWQLDSGDWSNNGYENEDLIVWMRTAAFPTFRKLYRRIDHTQEGYLNGMPQDDYFLHVNYRYPVESFQGHKRFILSTTSFLGGKNNFLGIAYISVGSICLLLGVVFLIVHIKYGKRPSDMQNITQNTPFTD